MSTSRQSTPIPSPSPSAPATPTTPATLDIAIVGAGIGGLAAAVALNRAGFDTHVFERAPELREVGGAVVIRQPSVDLLQSWELDAFFDQAVAVGSIQIHDAAGTIKGDLDADFIGDGQAWSTHRADLHDLLAAAVGDDHLHLGLTATSVRNADNGQSGVVEFEEGGQITARVVVGADGIRSVARRAVIDDEPVFAGLVVLRGVAPVDALPAGATNDRIHMWADGTEMMTTLPLRAGTLVAMDTIVAQDDAPAALWTAEVPTADLLARFAGFDEGLRTLIAAGTVPVRANPVYDRDPIDTWVAGRIVLLGDAAHPMAPRQGQGANQAIQDAGALARGLLASGLDDPTAGLRSYQDERVAPATALQLASRGAPEHATPH